MRAECKNRGHEGGQGWLQFIMILTCLAGSFLLQHSAVLMSKRQMIGFIQIAIVPGEKRKGLRGGIITYILIFIAYLSEKV